MGDKKVNKQSLLKIVAAASVAIFSLLSVCTGAFAWFLSTRDEAAMSDNFKVDKVMTSVRTITVHSFLGESSDGCFNFNPNGVVAYDPNKAGQSGYDSEGFYTGEAVALNEYSLESPDHPVLMMFEVSGAYQSITFSTDYAFLGSNMPSSVDYEVATYSALPAANASNNNKLFKVLADEEHGGVATIYQYIHSGTGGTYEMLWVDLGVYDDLQESNPNHKGFYNPLSSVVNFYWYEYTGVIDNVNLATENNIVVGKNGIKSDINGATLADGTHSISIAKSTMTSSNYSSFSNFTNEETFSYRNKKVVYENDVNGKTYIGIVVNYSPYALEYIFSNNLGHEALSYGLKFKCDWVTEF